MLTDPWLNRWLPLVRERAGKDSVLEIGCGHGDDTAVLSNAGLSVYAFDLSRTAAGLAKIRVPKAVVECRDVRDPFPEQCCEPGVVVASLSLHYFAWDETQALIRKIRSTLRPGGILLCRLNSTQDRNFGASGHPQLESNFFLVDGVPKRFFDEASIESLFAVGWKRISVEHYFTGKYVKSKALWEVVLEKEGA
ncbi:class I SAM-dependent methyltransferase [Halomonas citrativorans]|nr:class I SAM-dependent methyltransferase [Halomonas citrativorans]